MRVVPRKLRFYLALEPSLSLPLPRNCTREFVQFILPEEFVVPVNFGFMACFNLPFPVFDLGM